ncbi:hypothetical protein [Paeniglutamicibacter antarcticus]|uniref:Uncharacterized protein n=1 Tax=Paeniglutamicibacter antarcticus TaxID=494023 RepID=A0ABP9TQV6_9MICC
MNKNEPVNARIRLAIAQWPGDAPRGAVSTFCTDRGISRKTFYAIRARARDEVQSAVMEPRSRRPKTSPSLLTEDRKDEALKVRAPLESSRAGPMDDQHARKNGVPWKACPLICLAGTDLPGKESGPTRPEPIPGLPDLNPPGAGLFSVAQRLLAAAEQPEATAIGAAKETILATIDQTRPTGSITHLSGTGSRKLNAYPNGVVDIGRTIFSLTASMSGRTVIASWDAGGVIFNNTQDEVLADFAWPPTGTTYVGITKSRTLFGKDQQSGQLSPKS